METEKVLFFLDVAGIALLGAMMIHAALKDKPRRFASVHKCEDDCPGDGTCEHTKVCMCGLPMENHYDASHTAVSMHDYYGQDVWVDK